MNMKTEQTCSLSIPAGWVCTRAEGHKGPCAAVPIEEGQQWLDSDPGLKASYMKAAMQVEAERNTLLAERDRLRERVADLEKCNLELSQSLTREDADCRKVIDERDRLRNGLRGALGSLERHDAGTADAIRAQCAEALKS